MAKQYKPGQIITIGGTKYRITKNKTELFICEQCKIDNNTDYCPVVDKNNKFCPKLPPDYYLKLV